MAFSMENRCENDKDKQQQYRERVAMTIAYESSRSGCLSYDFIQAIFEYAVSFTMK